VVALAEVASSFSLTNFAAIAGCGRTSAPGPCTAPPTRRRSLRPGGSTADGSAPAASSAPRPPSGLPRHTPAA